MAVSAGLTLLSPRFEYGGDYLSRPIPLLVALMVGASLAYLAGVLALRRVAHYRLVFPAALVVGAIMRAALFPSGPILEDDFYRYLWEGGLTANGINPFARPPESALPGSDSSVPDEIRALAEDSGDVIRRVNHPELGTVYPPVAQGAFAAAHFLKPWSLRAWRIVILILDVATVVFLVQLLKALKLPAIYGAIYWCNPLLVKELYNSSHMDIIPLAFVVAALYFTVTRRPVGAAAALALAVASKIWPIILLPILARPFFEAPRKLAAGAITFVGVVIVAFLPAAAAVALRGQSGFLAYSREWEMNDALFMAALWVMHGLYSVTGFVSQTASPELMTRIAFVLLLGAWVVRLSYRSPLDGEDVCRRVLYAAAALFLLSPTQYPWYYLWLLPLLSLRPTFSLLLLTATLPLYYLRFHFSYRNDVDVFDKGIVWLEYVPVWILLVWEMYRERGVGSQTKANAAVK